MPPIEMVRDAEDKIKENKYRKWGKREKGPVKITSHEPAGQDMDIL